MDRLDEIIALIRKIDADQQQLKSDHRVLHTRFDRVEEVTGKLDHSLHGNGRAGLLTEVAVIKQEQSSLDEWRKKQSRRWDEMDAADKVGRWKMVGTLIAALSGLGIAMVNLILR